jgi:hypothetical protein
MIAHLTAASSVKRRVLGEVTGGSFIGYTYLQSDGCDDRFRGHIKAGRILGRNHRTVKPFSVAFAATFSVVAHPDVDSSSRGAAPRPQILAI